MISVRPLKLLPVFLILFSSTPTYAATYGEGDVVTTSWSVTGTGVYPDMSIVGELQLGWNIGPDTDYTYSFLSQKMGTETDGDYWNTSAHTLWVCSKENSSGNYTWRGKNISEGTSHYSSYHNWLVSLPVVSSTPDDSECGPVTDCSSKAGTVSGYNIATYTEGSSPNLSDQCVDGCAVSAEIHESLGPCVNSQCVVSLKYTYTGSECGSTDEISLDDNEPGQCYAQWTALVNKCGGSSKVSTFDWSTCTGECLKDDCGDKYDDLAQVCGGYLYIASWDNTTCQGVCANFSTPSTTNGDAAPSSVSTETKTNSDGTSSTTTNTTYTIDNTTYTNTTTKTYDSSGNETGSSTTVTTGPSSDSDDSDDDSDDETFSSITSSGFGESYGTGEFDIPGRFTTFLTTVKSSGLFSFSSDFFESLPGGGSSTYEIDGGETFGHHSIDLDETLSVGLAVLKTILLVIFGFLSIRAIIMKR